MRELIEQMRFQIESGLPVSTSAMLEIIEQLDTRLTRLEQRRTIGTFNIEGGRFIHATQEPVTGHRPGDVSIERPAPIIHSSGNVPLGE